MNSICYYGDIVSKLIFDEFNNSKDEIQLECLFNVCGICVQCFSMCIVVMVVMLIFMMIRGGSVVIVVMYNNNLYEIVY